VRSGGFELLLLGGRAGVGKTSVAYEVSAVLRGAGVAHCHIEGDVLDAAYPKPADDPDGSSMTERNLRSLTREYRRLGYTRLIYVNTVSVLEPDLVRRAVGDVDSVVSVLLQADGAAVEERLASRELGSELPRYLARGPGVAQALAAEATSEVHRLDVTHSSVQDAAARVLELTGWLPGPDAAVEAPPGQAPSGADRAGTAGPPPDEVVPALVTRADADAVADFLTSSDWPFHAGGRPTWSQVMDRVRSGYYDADGTETFLVSDAHRTVALIRIDDLHDDTAMFDVRVAEGERSRGVGTRVVTWATSHVFSTYPSVIRVEATTRHGNAAMRQVLHRCGYAQESQYRACWPDAHGNLVDAVGYAVLRREWETGMAQLDPPIDTGAIDAQV